MVIIQFFDPSTDRETRKLLFHWVQVRYGEILASNDKEDFRLALEDQGSGKWGLTSHGDGGLYSDFVISSFK